MHTNVNTALLTTLLLLSSSPQHLAAAQTNPKDAIDFRDVPAYIDLRKCVQQCFYFVGSSPVALTVGCETNKCLCASKTIFDLGVEAAGKCAEACNTIEDTEAAKSVFAEYCKMKEITPEPPQGEAQSTSTTASIQKDPIITKPTPTAVLIISSTPPLIPDIVTTPPVSSTPVPQNSSPTTQTVPSATPTDVKSSGANSKMSVSEMIGTGVGVAGLFVAVLTLWITWKKRKQKHENELRAAQEVEEVQFGGGKNNNYETYPLHHASY